MADKTGEDSFRKTTRDEPNYDHLMRDRLQVLNRLGITIDLFQEVIDGLEPLPGAKEFLDKLRDQTQVIILSNTYEQFAYPLLKKLGFPTIFCHTLEINDKGMISNYFFRQEDQKRKAVKAFHSLNYKVIASGDSYNDVTMLDEADHGILFCPPKRLEKERADLPVAHDYDKLLSLIQSQLD